MSPEVLAVGPFFVVIPTVVVLMSTVVDAGLLLVIVVAVLRRGAGSNCQGSRMCGPEKGEPQIWVCGFYFVLLLNLGNPTLVSRPAASMPGAAYRSCSI